MQIYLARNNQQAGPYTLEQLNQMLASQQVLLTDLAWHQGMQEWKALGELTQGKLVYNIQTDSISPIQETVENASTTQTKLSFEKQIRPHHTSSTPVDIDRNLASIGSRFGAKVLDLLLWLPIASIPAFFFNPEQMTKLVEIQQKMQSVQSSTQAQILQTEFIHLIPAEAWQMMGLYIVIMLAIQAFLLARTGQSIGKKIMKIKIVDAIDASPVNLTRIFLLRSMVFIILNLLFMPITTIIDYAFGLSQKRQTLHDKLARTKVIKQ